MKKTKKKLYYKVRSDIPWEEMGHSELERHKEEVFEPKFHPCEYRDEPWKTDEHVCKKCPGYIETPWEKATCFVMYPHKGNREKAEFGFIEEWRYERKKSNYRRIVL